MFEDLYNAVSLLGSWRWPEAIGEVTAAEIERIIGDGRLRLAVAYKFFVNGDGPYTGESFFWNPTFSVDRRALAMRRRILARRFVVVRFRKNDPSVNRLDRRAWTMNSAQSGIRMRINIRIDTIEP